MEPTWQTDDGSVRLYLGDCRIIIPLLDSPDAVITDPPYGIGYSSGQGSEFWGDGSIDRRFIGIEKDPGYFAIAAKRIQAELARHPLFEAAS